MDHQRREVLSDLLLQWEDQYQRGQDIPPSELAREYPELVDELSLRIKAMKATSWLASPLTNTAAIDQDAPIESSSRRTLANRYRLDELIALGGFAEVWRAYDSELQRSVAVKIPKATQGQSADNFMAEARRVARLRHSGIVPVYDVGREGDQCFIVSEFMDGGSLATWLAKKPTTHDQVVRWISRIADALEYAHINGVIHRDVKPANILINHHEEAFLGDFGIAQSANKTGRFDPSLGTLFYMSPEQLEGRPITPSSDVFGLAVVLYEALTGEMPYSSSDPNVIRQEITKGWKKPWPSKMPQRLIPVLSKAMHRNPQERHSSAAHFGAELKRAWAAPARRGWVPWFVAAVAAAAVVAGVLFLRSPTPSSPAVPTMPAPTMPVKDSIRDDLEGIKASVQDMTATIVREKQREVVVVPKRMVLVAGGTLPANSPQAGTVVKPFLIANCEVTTKEYREVLKGAAERGYNITGLGKGSTEETPIVHVNWHTVLLWCNCKSEREGLRPVYLTDDGEVHRTTMSIPKVDPSANGCRLPTDVEWEWAARGGAESKNYQFSGSDNVDEVAWYPVNARGPMPVGQKKPNELGLYDMIGNVREWTWSPIASLPEPMNRVVRGGGWVYEHNTDLLYTDRSYARRPHTSQPDLGFRLARNADESQ